MQCPFCRLNKPSLACSDCVNYACEKAAKHAITLNAGNEREAVRAAVEAEIVAWLRNDDICKTPKGTFTVEFEDLADAIERGEHRAKK